MVTEILTRCAFGLENVSEKPCPFHDKFKGIREEFKILFVKYQSIIWRLKQNKALPS